MKEAREYDPSTFWNEKARASAGDRLAAVCHSDAGENRNIEAVQRRLVGRAMARVGQEVDLGGVRLLDYGCGVGRWASFFRGLGTLYHGVDLAEAMIALARSDDPGGDYRVLGEGSIPFPDAAFDVVCSIAVLHHNPLHEQERIADELARVMRRRGYVVLFESVGEPQPAGSIEFPRLRTGWESMMADREMDCVWYQGARYFAVRYLAERVLGVFGPSLRSGGTWRRALDRVGAIVDPRVGVLVPERYHRRAAMVFRRRR
jgi:SAM-dependent methyltransferase